MRTFYKIPQTSHYQFPLNIVDSQGLKLMCRKPSKRYSNQKSQQKVIKSQRSFDRKIYTTEVKRKENSNRIYFKSNKVSKDDQRCFSDYKIKYGPLPICQYRYQVKKLIKNPELQSSNFQVKLESPKIQKQQIKKNNIISSDNQISVQNKTDQNIKQKFEKQSQIQQEARKNTKNKVQNKRKAQFLRISHSFKNCNKFKSQMIKKEEIQNKLDGWAIIQSPLYEIDKKLDIIDYTAVDQNQVRNFFSERKLRKDKQKQIKKISLLKVQ